MKDIIVSTVQLYTCIKNIIQILSKYFKIHYPKAATHVTVDFSAGTV